MYHSFRTDPEWERTYAEHYAALNPWTSTGASGMQTGRVLVSDALISKAVLKKTEFYTGWLREQDVLHSLAAVIERTDDRLTFLAVQRSPRRGSFGADEVRFVEPLMTHLRRAFELHRRLGARRARDEALVEVAERSHGGMFIVDRRGRVIFANRAATHLGRDTTDAVLATAARGGGVVRRIAQSSLWVRVTPLRASRTLLGVPGAAYAIFVIAPGRPPVPSMRALRELFGLTTMEASVALALARGASLRQVAADNEVGVVTVRTHLAHLFEKTGTARQAELVRLVLSLAPPV